MRNTRSMVIADTGYWVALFSARDPYHHRARKASSKFEAEGIVTTQAVIGESCYMLRRWAHPELAAHFLETLAQLGVEIFEPSSSLLSRSAVLMRKYCDLPMDYADASLVLLAEHLGHGRILTTDQRDFGTYRWKNHYPFESVLEEDTE